VSRIRVSGAAAVCLGLLAACGSNPPAAAPPASTAAPSTSSPASAPASSGAAAGPAGAGDTAYTLVKSGFGKSDQYAWVAALVRNDSGKPGGTVVVHFNLMAGGELVASADQTEAFSRPGEVLDVGTQVTVPAGKTPTKLVPTVSIDYPGIGPTTAVPEEPIDTVTVSPTQAGTLEASGILTNPTDQPLKNVRIGVICLGADLGIIGGGSAGADLVPAHGKTKVTTTGLIVTGTPVGCEMRVIPAV
jgi:hypothetical protein